MKYYSDNSFRLKLYFHLHKANQFKSAWNFGVLLNWHPYLLVLFVLEEDCLYYQRMFDSDLKM